MQNSQDIQRDLSAVSIDAIGGEPLAGSGFEAEEPDPGFSATELGREGVTPWRPRLPSPPNITSTDNPIPSGLSPGGHRQHRSNAGARRRSVAETLGAGSQFARHPVQPQQREGYRGGNAIHLMATGLQRGYEDPRWMTYKQASDNGWQVRRGEKGTQIEYWEVKSASDKTQPSRPDGSWRREHGNGQQCGYREIAAHPSRLHRLQRPADRPHSAARPKTAHHLRGCPSRRADPEQLGREHRARPSGPRILQPF